jgi:hypothetical protein
MRTSKQLSKNGCDVQGTRANTFAFRPVCLPKSIPRQLYVYSTAISRSAISLIWRWRTRIVPMRAWQWGIAAAVASFEAALEREASYPNIGTRAAFDLPRLVALERLRPLYPRALELLDKVKGKLVFHADHYLWNGSRALILHDKGEYAEASATARAALAAAEKTDSGFRYHPDVGLVASTMDDFGKALRAVAHRERAPSAKATKSWAPFWRKG